MTPTRRGQLLTSCVSLHFACTSTPAKRRLSSLSPAVPSKFILVLNSFTRAESRLRLVKIKTAPIPLSLFNYLFTICLLTNFSINPFEDHMYMHMCSKLTNSSGPPEDPLIDEAEMARYIKCIEAGIEKGIIIIMTKSHGFRYVIDDGIVFGGRFTRESGNYWVFIDENNYINARILGKDGSPRRGRFTSIFEGQFTDILNSMDESDKNWISRSINYDRDTCHVNIEHTKVGNEGESNKGPKFGMLSNVSIAIPKIISVDVHDKTDRTLRVIRSTIERTIKADLLACGRPFDRGYVLREAAELTQNTNNLRCSSGLKFPGDPGSSISLNINGAFRRGFSRRYHNSSSSHFSDRPFRGDFKFFPRLLSTLFLNLSRLGAVNRLFPPVTAQNLFHHLFHLPFRLLFHQSETEGEAGQERYFSSLSIWRSTKI